MKYSFFLNEGFEGLRNFTCWWIMDLWIMDYGFGRNA